MRKYILFLLLALTAQATDWHVTVDGTSNGAGTLLSPWSMDYALSHPPSVQPGDTIYAHAGEYYAPASQGSSYLIGGFRAKLTGTPGNYITFMPWPGDSVVINGLYSDWIQIFKIDGAWAIYKNLEIYNSNPDRIAETNNSNGPGVRGAGVAIYGSNVKFINNVIHDAGTGIGFWLAAVDSEIYGNIVFNNGWISPQRAHGHALYTQNDTGLKLIKDNIFFNQLAGGVQIYGTDNTRLRNFLYEGNTVFNDDLISSGGNGGVWNLDYKNSYYYGGITGTGTISFHASFGGGKNLKVRDSYFGNTRPQFRWSDTMTVTGNTFTRYATNWTLNMEFETYGGASQTGSVGTYYFNNNRYHRPPNQTKVAKNNPKNGTASTLYSLTQLKALYSDTAAAYYETGGTEIVQPTMTETVVYLRPNAYDDHRANVTIYNWSRANTVAINVSSLNWAAGTQWKLWNVQNWPSEFTTGTFSSGSTITAPMTGWTTRLPIGRNTVVEANTFPEFGVFLLTWTDPVVVVNGLSNNITAKSLAVETQTNRVYTITRPFVQDEICDYPKPFIDDNGATVWQAERINRWPVSSTCPSGSVKTATISWQSTYLQNNEYRIDFRNSTNPCSAGNQTACNNAALDEAGMLAYGGGTWTTDIRFTPNPSGSGSVRTFDARAALDAGNFTYRLRGPAVTEVIVADQTSSRTYDFGWMDWRHNRINTPGYGAIGAGDTSITILDGTKWATITTPFTIVIDSEHIGICYVSGNTLTVGTTNGASAACANVAGRGLNGSSAAAHSYGLYGNFARYLDNIYLTADMDSYAMTFTVNDASSINTPTVLQIGSEQVRVCNRSGNTLTVGTTSWPCAANSSGRYWNGTSMYGAESSYWVAYTPLYNLTVLSDRWYDAPTVLHKSIHPEAILRFPKDAASVGVAYVVNNEYLTSMQDQEYDVLITVNGSTVYGLTDLRHIPRTSHRYPVYNQNDSFYWSGTAPTFLRINHNKTYLSLTGAVNYDPSITVNSTFTNSILTENATTNGAGPEPAWNGGNNDHCVPDTKNTFAGTYYYVKGSVLRQINTPGGRPDIGPMSYWDLGYLYGMELNSSASDSLEEVSKSIVNCVSQIPVFHRETDTGLFCNNGDTPSDPTKSCTGGNLAATAFNRFISIDLHPQATPINPSAVTNIADRWFYVGPVTSNRIVINTGAVSHMTSTFLPALLTGDYFAEEVTIRLGGNTFAMSEFPTYNSAEVTADRVKTRHEDWGWMSYRDGIRQVAWSLRNWANAWYIAKDSTPEKEYIARKINANIGKWEGQYNLTTGSFYTACPSPLGTQYDNSWWCLGRTFAGMEATLTTTFPAEPGQGYGAAVMNDQLVWNIEAPWMRNYWLVALSDADRKGFTTIRPVRKHLASGMLTQATQVPNWSFWFESYFNLPQVPCRPEGTPVAPATCAAQSMIVGSGQWQFNSWANRKAGFLTGGSPTGVPASSVETDLMSGYWHIAGAAIKANRDADYGSTYFGERARSIIISNLRYQTYANNPMWAVLPWTNISPSVQIGDTTALITATLPYGGNCKITITPAFSNSDDGLDSNCSIQGSRLQHTARSLSANTNYYYRITVNNQVRYYGKFTTAAPLGGAINVILPLTAPANYGTVADVVTEYGNSSSLGSSVTTSCSITCNVSIPANVGRVLFFRNTWRSSTPDNLVSSSIYSQMITQ